MNLDRRSPTAAPLAEEDPDPPDLHETLFDRRAHRWIIKQLILVGMSGGGERGYARGAGTATSGEASIDLDRRPRFPVPTAEAPDRKRVRAIRDRFREVYGSRRNEPHGDPVHELVLTILSQNTSDGNRDVAYRRLRDRFGDWERSAKLRSRT